MHIREWNGNSLIRTWGLKDQPQTTPTAIFWIRAAVARTFLPEAYPDSVSIDYLAFQAWDTVQALSSYVRGMLSSQAVMTGIGVGKEAATAYGAVFLFAVRDLTGMCGGLIFAHSEGSSFDSCAKQWRIFADVMNDIGYALDLASPLFPKAFLQVTCLGSLARAFVKVINNLLNIDCPVFAIVVAGGATRAALTQHFAKSSNAADIAAKEQSQETAVTALGMMIGIIAIRFCSDSAMLTWIWFAFLTAIHIWANIKAMRALVLYSINLPRLEALLAHYESKGKVLTPKEMSAAEDLMPPPFKRMITYIGNWMGFIHPQRRICFGASLTSVMAAAYKDPPNQDEALRMLLKEQGHRRYLIVETPAMVYVILHKDAGQQDVLRASVQAWKACHSLRPFDEKYFSGLEAKMQNAGWQLGVIRVPKGTLTAEWHSSHDD